QNFALQTQGELSMRSHFDYTHTGTSPVAVQGTRQFSDFYDTDFQFDIGPVMRYHKVQFAVLERLRYVNRQDFNSGGVLGQFFFNFNYLFGDRLAIGGYATRSNNTAPVVKTRQFDTVLFEETYLKVVNQAGVNFNATLFNRPSYHSSIEGSMSFLDAT